MNSMLSANPTILRQLKFIFGIISISFRDIVLSVAFFTNHMKNLTSSLFCHNFERISLLDKFGKSR